MSEQAFLQLLQSLLTMVNPESPESVACAKNTISSVLALAKASGKANSITIRLMYSAERQFEALVDYRNDFIGVPGEYEANMAKKRRLLQMLRPGC